MDKRTQQGFTLYELLITLLVIGVILALGVPNLQQFTRNSRITATANDLHSSFLLARSEATRIDPSPVPPDNASVTICSSLNPLDANPNCGGTFASGWIVFVDVDGDIVRDAGEVVLRSYPPIDATVSISTNGGANYFSFARTGLGRGNVGGAGPALTSAAVCDDRGNGNGPGNDSTARAVVATLIGRATVIRDQTQVGQQIANNALSCP